MFCGKLDKKEWVYVAGEEALMGFQGSEVPGQTAWERAEPPVLQSSEGNGEELILRHGNEMSWGLGLVFF